MPCRNEDWIVGLTARALMRWVDHLVVLDHASTDSTPDILFNIAREHPGRVTVLNEPDGVWEEMRHRQRLLDEGRKRGATHIALVDADEILTGNLVESVRQMLAEAPAGSIFQLPWLCLRGSVNRYHATGVWSEQQVSTGFRDDPAYFWSSAGRGGYDLHHRHPMGRFMPPCCPIPVHGAKRHSGGLMHLQFVSGRRLRAKQAWYKMQEVLRWPGRDSVSVIDQRYNLAVYGQSVASAEVPVCEVCPPEWWGGYEDLMIHLKPHIEPWQEAKVKEALAVYGAKKFAGLDLFGVGEKFHARD